MIATIYAEVPTYDNGTWTTTIFETREAFKDFVTSIFKEDGPETGYGFNEVSELFNEQAKKFTEHNLYCISPLNSPDYLNYWGTKKGEHILSEKSKCRRGVIFKSNGSTFYLTRDYYFWINFLPIYDKEKKKFDFPQIWDSQYHAALYELLAELNYKHVALLKKRQWGNSYIHAAKLLNQFWFEDGSTLKVGASVKNYINENGLWKIFNEYRNFLNKRTGWYRGCDPDKTMTWQQRQKISTYETGSKKEEYDGNGSTLVGISFDKDPTAGVGGNISYFYHEEAGIAPKMGTTYEYIRPALSSGMITTGTFIAAGSVGDLDQCKPLKEMILKPTNNSIFAVSSALIDDKGTVGESGLFIPEHWSMPPYIDKYGNSLVKEAKEAILKEREVWKKTLDKDTYQLRISQKPMNIHEAFAFRRESVFPVGLINKQIERIENGEYPVEYVDLERDASGKIQIKPSYKTPITELGSAVKSLDDKTGVICMYERPIKEKPDFGTYYASIDPVKEGQSTTSESLCSIFVYKTRAEVTTVDAGDKKNVQIDNRLDQDKIVLSWAGRFDDLEDTHERLELIIEFYNAQAIVEKNVSQFINYMQYRKKQHYLVPRSMLLTFNKDQRGISQTFQEYGWNNSTAVFQHILSYGISYLKEEIDRIDKPDGTIIKIMYGVERIPDIMLLREMLSYQDDKGNYDRIVAYCALVAFATIQAANRGYRKAVEKREDLENPNKLRNFLMGGPAEQTPNPWGKTRNPFRNIRL